MTETRRVCSGVAEVTRGFVRSSYLINLSLLFSTGGPDKQGRAARTDDSSLWSIPHKHMKGLMQHDQAGVLTGVCGICSFPSSCS